MATGESLLSLEQIFVIAEMEIVCELQGDVRKAIAALYAIYYNYIRYRISERMQEHPSSY